MTIAVIWILLQNDAPWWCFTLTVAAFFAKVLLMLAALGKNNERRS